MTFSDKLRLVRESGLVADVLDVCGVEGGPRKWICPFHDDTDPSMAIREEGTRYHCYGCGSHGDAVTLVQHFYTVGFREAVEMLYGGMRHPGWTVDVLERLEKNERRDELGAQRAVCRYLWASAVRKASTARKGDRATWGEIEALMGRADYHADRAVDAESPLNVPPNAYLGLISDIRALDLLVN